jgi:hypothetical protein
MKGQFICIRACLISALMWKLLVAVTDYTTRWQASVGILSLGFAENNCT